MEARNHALADKRVTDKIWNVKKPIVAAINGLCLGGGLECAMSCDLGTASSKTRFGRPEINIGIMPGGADTRCLLRMIGVYQGQSALLHRGYDWANEALAMGFINLFSGLIPRSLLREKYRLEVVATPLLAAG